MSPLLLSRIQFGFVMSFHILFPAFTIGLASWLAFLGGMYLKTQRVVWRELYLFWLKIFAVSFGLGVVSGIVMSFQFGTNWSELSIRAGNILGPLLSYEVLTAFFLEASFLGVMLFGWTRVSPRVHFFATCMVAVGTLISTFWIISANSWMHTPAGYEIKDGIFHPQNWWAIVFNPSFPYRLVHMTLAAFITTCFVIGGISAIYLLRNRHQEAALLQLKLAIVFGAIAVPLQIIAGDFHGLEVREYQPAKLAAIEGHWETGRGVPLVLWAVPDAEAERNRQEIKIPRLGSLILTHEWNGEVKGLKSFPRDERPPVAPVFYAFRVMVGIGIAMLVVVAWSLIQWRRGALLASKTLLRAWMLLTPMGFIAVLAGWYTTEIGRQPWIIYGLMRTSEATSNVDAGSVLISLFVFGAVYLFVFTAGTWYLFNLLRKGPLPVDAAQLHPQFKSAAHPMSLPDEKIERP
ncbi:MAG: cytochrome ubiquinol oxidase subunit I [Candidatus Obscuribacterales bacterium]|nr:cytochrome ubiquinol oxidase subunit I [Steroidobacteraceae bacterium]